MTKISTGIISIPKEVSNINKKVRSEKNINPIKQVADNIDTKKDTRQTHFIPKPAS